MGPIENILVEAKKLVSNPDTFLTNDFAKDKNGETVDPASANAVRWCSLGAVQKFGGTGYQYELTKVYLGRAVRELIEPSYLDNCDTKGKHIVVHVNDWMPQHIKKVFAKAIEFAAKDGV